MLLMAGDQLFYNYAGSLALRYLLQIFCRCDKSYVTFLRLHNPGDPGNLNLRIALNQSL